MGDVDSVLQLELAGRLVLAAVLGGVIGAERELHAHPAGMRTHLLVATGCALFTVLSIYGFLGGPSETAAVDPSRVAAQIVTGMGFIGAGAILKYGTSIRGLTTAASIWSTAAIGMAAGTGQWPLALVATIIVLISLWPLSRLARWLRARGGDSLRTRVMVRRLETLGTIAATLRERGVAIESVRTERRTPASFELELELRLPARLAPDAVISAIDAVPDVDLVESEGSVE
jgi:putative Mg2+ transporter-C (MgtC) family protein